MTGDNAEVKTTLAQLAVQELDRSAQLKISGILNVFQLEQTLILLSLQSLLLPLSKDVSLIGANAVVRAILVLLAVQQLEPCAQLRISGILSVFQ